MKLILKATIASVVAAGCLFAALRLLPSSVACQRPPINDPQMTWAKEPLRGSDWPFQQAQWRIERLFENTDLARKRRIVNDFKSDAYRNPQDAVKQYAYAYATFLVVREYEWSLTKEEQQELLCGVYNWMAQPPSPASFEYARLRFMIAYMIAPDGRLGKDDPVLRDVQHVVDGVSFKELGERLLQRRPNDNVFKYYVVKIVSVNDSDERLKLSLEQAAEVQKAFPKHPSSYRLLAVAWKRWLSASYSSAAADKSIAYWKMFGKHLPSQSWARKRVPIEIQNVENERNRYKDKGWLKP